MNINFDQVPAEIRQVIQCRSASGEPFRLEVTEEKFLFEIPAVTPKPTAYYLYKIVDLLGIVAIVGFITYACSGS